MSKYHALTRYLRGREETVVKMSFSQVEDVLGFPLPHSARAWQPWWHAGSTHSQCRGWTDAGRRAVDVDRRAETVSFVRAA